MKLIVDKRMRLQEKQYMRRFGELVEIEPQNSVYDEISGHPDIFLTKINNKIFKAPNLLSMHKDLLSIPIGEEKVGYKYPDDIKYNICQMGNNVIHDFRYTDKKILEYIKSEGLTQIQVSQGYTKCNIAVTSPNSCITSDEKIYNILKLIQIDVLLLKNEPIKLLDKKGNISNMTGFIGGASCKLYNKFILFGDVTKLKQEKELINHLKKYQLELIDFKGLEIYDYGGVITI